MLNTLKSWWLSKKSVLVEANLVGLDRPNEGGFGGLIFCVLTKDNPDVWRLYYGAGTQKVFDKRLGKVMKEIGISQDATLEDVSAFLRENATTINLWKDKESTFIYSYKILRQEAPVSA